MNNFQKGTRLKLRFPSPNGLISIERLWEFKGSKLPQLAAILKELDSQIVKETPDSLDFLKSNAPKADSTIQLMFDIAKEVYIQLQSEIEDAAEAKDKKEHNEKILKLIAEKREDAQKSMSEEELMKLLK